jgi:hypothetical protein
MGQEHSSHSQRNNVETSSPSGRHRSSSSRLRKTLTRGVAKRGQEPEIPTVKKAKLPEGQAYATVTDAQARDRLMSCPDFHHHTEAEMVKRLERLLVPQVQPEKATSPGNHDCTPTQLAAMKLFDGANPPKITLASYLQRMVYYLGGIAENERKCGVDENVHSDLAVRYILTSLLYMERLQAKTGMKITLYNVHRLLITGIMIAAKVLDDFQPHQKYFADLGGVSAAELTRLEAAFLQLCDYNVNVNPEIFAAKYADALERERVFSDVNEALTLGAVFSPKMPSHKQIMV